VDFESTIPRFESWRPSQPPSGLPPLPETPLEWPRTSGLSPVTVTPETGLFPGNMGKLSVLAQLSLDSADASLTLASVPQVTPEVRIQLASNKLLLMFESDALSQPPPASAPLSGPTRKRPRTSALFPVTGTPETGLLPKDLSKRPVLARVSLQRSDGGLTLCCAFPEARTAPYKATRRVDVRMS
jgi:hypothetical protein